jgi:hypothetical protein
MTDLADLISLNRARERAEVEEQRRTQEIATQVPARVHCCSTLLSANQEFETENETPAGPIPGISVASGTIFHRSDD